jgi:hypothetical protein
VLVNIPEIGLAGWKKAAMTVSLQLGHNLTHGPDRAPQHQQTPFDLMSLSDHLGRRGPHQAFLDGIESMGKEFQYGKVTVDQTVDERMTQHAGMNQSLPGLIELEPPINGIEHITGRRLHSQQGVASKKERNLAAANHAPTKTQFPNDDEQSTREIPRTWKILKFWAQIPRPKVLAGNRVNVVLVRQGLEKGFRQTSLQMDPADFRPVGSMAVENFMGVVKDLSLIASA